MFKIIHTFPFFLPYLLGALEDYILFLETFFGSPDIILFWHLFFHFGSSISVFQEGAILFTEHWDL